MLDDALDASSGVEHWTGDNHSPLSAGLHTGGGSWEGALETQPWRRSIPCPAPRPQRLQHTIPRAAPVGYVQYGEVSRKLTPRSMLVFTRRSLSFALMSPYTLPSGAQPSESVDTCRPVVPRERYFICARESSWPSRIARRSASASTCAVSASVDECRRAAAVIAVSTRDLAGAMARRSIVEVTWRGGRAISWTLGVLVASGRRSSVGSEWVRGRLKHSSPNAISDAIVNWFTNLLNNAS